MSHDHLSRGVPAQHLPENQDPDVQFNLDEVTGAVTPLRTLQVRVESAPKGRKRAATAKTADPSPDVSKEAPGAPGAGE